MCAGKCGVPVTSKFKPAKDFKLRATQSGAAPHGVERTEPEDRPAHDTLARWVRLPSQGRRSGRFNILRQTWQATVALLCAYAILFLALHRLASIWGSSVYYSLWFPAAGLRFATLWHFGARLTPAIAITELAALTLVGVVRLGGNDTLLMALSVLGPSLSYGLAIAIARRVLPAPASLNKATDLRLGLAVILAPFLGWLGSIPFWHFLGLPVAETAVTLVRAGVIFVLGDILGILIIVPPLLSAAEIVETGSWPRRANWHAWLEVGLISLISAGVVLAVRYGGYGFHLGPLLLAVGWIGLRFGRMAAWIAIVMIAATILPMAAHVESEVEQVRLHIMLMAISTMGFMAGIYSDAELRMRQDLRRRDRVIFQAERLKTLKAMSLSMIHELSQPLSTLSIETKYLAKIAEDDGTPSELRRVAGLVAKKTHGLSELLKHLRGFGGRGDETSAVVSVEALLLDVINLIAADARTAAVRLEIHIEEGLQVRGIAIELQQALLNLMRNALLASPSSTIQLAAQRVQNEVQIAVTNEISGGKAAAYPGMGMGRLVVEAIAEAHQGRVQTDRDGERWTAILAFPALGRDGTEKQ